MSTTQEEFLEELDEKTIRVRSTSDVHQIAAAIRVVVLDQHRMPIVRAIGAGAVAQACKGIAIARGFVAPQGMDLACTIGFTKVPGDDGRVLVTQTFHLFLRWAVQYPSLYRAKAASVAGGRIKAFIPQVFGDAEVVITAWMGGPPTEPGMGWVFFQSGNPEFPVWAGVGAVTTTGGEAPVGPISYTHTQTNPNTIWTITHNLGFYPGYHAEDTDGNDIEGEVNHVSVNQMTLTFSRGIAGKAYLS